MTLVIYGRYSHHKETRESAPTGVGFLYDAGLRMVSIRSSAHLYGVEHSE